MSDEFDEKAQDIFLDLGYTIYKRPKSHAEVKAVAKSLREIYIRTLEDIAQLVEEHNIALCTKPINKCIASMIRNIKEKK